MITTESTLFEAVFMRYYSLVYQLAYRYVGQRDEAEDIVQEVFLRFHRTPPQERHEEAQRAWLCRVTSHLSLNALRNKQRRLDREERVFTTEHISMMDGAETRDPEQIAVASEQGQFIRSILAELPERQQTLLILRSVGLSYADIARSTGLSASSIGPLMTRAVREFRRKYVERTAAFEGE
jgi:RNA polymerase sigma-70 factor (ECF subfamily)